MICRFTYTNPTYENNKQDMFNDEKGLKWDRTYSFKNGIKEGKHIIFQSYRDIIYFTFFGKKFNGCTLSNLSGTERWDLLDRILEFLGDEREEIPEELRGATIFTVSIEDFRNSIKNSSNPLLLEELNNTIYSTPTSEEIEERRLR